MTHYLLLFVLLLFAASMLAYKIFGVRRGTKLLTLALILCCFVFVLTQNGPVGLAVYIMILGLSTFLFVSHKIGSIRLPLRSNLRVVEAIDWPGYARDRVEALIKELPAHGFSDITCCVSHVNVGKKRITESIAISRNLDRKIWVRIGVNDSGTKIISRMACSMTADGKELATASNCINGEMFPDPFLLITHCPQDSSLGELLKVHRDFCEKHGPIRELDGDVVSNIISMGENWTNRMLDAGNFMLATGGSEVRISPHKLPALSLRAIVRSFV